MSAIHALLESAVDYAGLYPPAALDMPAAVANYAEYRRAPDAWMLGRFVVPAARLDDLDDALAAAAAGASASDGWSLSVTSGGDLLADFERVQAFNARVPQHRRVDSIEARLPTRDAISAAAAIAQQGVVVFAEIPVDEDPVQLVDTIAVAELNAKIRTGGITADAFPPPEAVVRFMERCMESGVPFKATAGLHHPVAAEYPLTYAPDAPRGAMYGFLNVLLADAALRKGVHERSVVALVCERDPREFTVTHEWIAWRDVRFSTRELAGTRAHAALSFGSCSFREPVDELRALGFLT